MVATGLPRYCYRVDVEDVIVWVDSWWFAFARENGASTLTDETVIGKLLWSFICDEATQCVFRAIHERVRSCGKSAILPFRCDSPLLKRTMRLTISSEPDGQLFYESTLLSAEPRRLLEVLDAAHPRNEAVLTLCSCCLQALIEPAGWLEIEEAAAMLRIFEDDRVPQLRYTICPACRRAMSRTPNQGTAV